MFKKLLVAALIVLTLGAMTTQEANAYGGPHGGYGYGGYHGGYGRGYGGGPGWGLFGLGVLGGVVVGEALAQPPVYVQPAPTVVYVQPTCRQVQQNMIINGQYTPVVRNVCLQADGSWQ